MVQEAKGEKMVHKKNAPGKVAAYGAALAADEDPPAHVGSALLPAASSCRPLDSAGVGAGVL